MADKKEALKRLASPIPTILLLQILEEAKTNRDAGILARLVRREITKSRHFV